MQKHDTVGCCWNDLFCWLVARSTICNVMTITRFAVRSKLHRKFGVIYWVSSLTIWAMIEQFNGNFCSSVTMCWCVKIFTRTITPHKPLIIFHISQIIIHGYFGHIITLHHYALQKIRRHPGLILTSKKAYTIMYV